MEGNMSKAQEKILAELDATLDQLIQNASVVCESNFQVLDTLELNSMYKTQESLLARFAHTQEELPENTSSKRYEQLHQKVEKLNQLNARFMQQLERTLCPRIGRNRKRSKLRELAKCRL